MEKILERMRIAEKNRVECYNKAFAARTNAESMTHALEAERWSNKWMRLLRQLDNFN